MAEFTPNFQSLKPSSFPLMDVNPNQNPTLLHNPNLNFLHNNIPVLFNDSFLANQTPPPPRFLENWGENFSQANQITPISHVFEPTNPFGNDVHGSNKRKLENDAYESSSANSTPQISENGIKTKNVFLTLILFGFLLSNYKTLMGIFLFLCIFMSAEHWKRKAVEKKRRKRRRETEGSGSC